MLNIQKLMIDPFIKELQDAYGMSYGSLEKSYSEILGWAGHLALENLSKTTALYHNVEHTMMVTLVGQEILKGKQLNDGGVSPKDWLHFIIALLCHDIGYLPGICKGDKSPKIVVDGLGNTVEILGGGTDASLTPYHVDRSKLFIHERFRGNHVIDAEKIVSYIEMTRFPIPDDDFHRDVNSFRGLARAADFIGQLGDPNYLRKLPALFYEFEETGGNEKLGYKNPEDMHRNFARFYWETVSPYIQKALKYLSVTQEGHQWISNLHSHVFETEHPGLIEY